MNIKKTTSTLMAAIVLVGAAALPAFGTETKPDIAANPMEEETVEMERGCCNPFTDCADLNKAAQMTGFSLSVPTIPDRVQCRQLKKTQKVLDKIIKNVVPQLLIKTNCGVYIYEKSFQENYYGNKKADTFGIFSSKTSFGERIFSST